MNDGETECSRMPSIFQKKGICSDTGYHLHQPEGHNTKLDKSATREKWWGLLNLQSLNQWLPGAGGRSGGLAFNNISFLLFSETRLNVAQAGPWVCSVAEDDLILLPLLLWNYKHIPPHPVCMEFGKLYQLGNIPALVQRFCSGC